MKLYVNQSGTKAYLDLNVASRQELARSIGSPWFNLNGNVYHVNEVNAETTINATATGAVVGGLIGLLGGPLGALLGGVVGGAIGNSDDNKDSLIVKRFNQSWYHG